jgi:hypothetical protein
VFTFGVEWPDGSEAPYAFEVVEETEEAARRELTRRLAQTYLARDAVITCLLGAKPC